MVTKHQRKQNRTVYFTHFQRTQRPRPAKTFHSCKCAQPFTSLKTKRKQLKVSSSIINGNFSFVHTSWGSMQSTDEYENTVTDQVENLNYEQKFVFQCILGSKP